MSVADGVSFRPIGVIHSPHTDPAATPRQPNHASGVRGRVEVFAEYSEGLEGIERYPYVYLFYVLDRASTPRLTVRPHGSREERGVFSTRAPCRPNPLGLSLVRLVRREGAVLHVEGLDVLDGTPLLDIKPYFRQLDGDDTTRPG